MTITTLLLMRQELLLTLLTVLVVIIDLVTADNKKDRVIAFTLVAFALVTLAGFLPAADGSLFGNMYHSTAMLRGMKNILNVALMILLLPPPPLPNPC